MEPSFDAHAAITMPNPSVAASPTVAPSPSSDMSPTLLRMAQQVRVNDLLDVAQALHASGRFDPMRPVDDHGNSFLPAWMRSNEPSSNRQPEFPGLSAYDLMDQWTGGQVWGQPNRQGKYPLDLWIRARHENPVYYPSHDAELADLVRRTPRAVLDTWTPARSLSAQDVARMSWQGSTLVAYLTTHSAEQALATLFDKGHTLLGFADQNQTVPVARFIRRASLWDAFLAQGGDPTLTIVHQDQRMALWEHLRDESRVYDGVANHQELSTFNERVMSWVTLNAGDALARRELQDYWKKLGPVRHGDRSKHMKSRPEWPTLQDDEGRTPMMLLAQNDPNAVKSFMDVQKSRSGASLLDHQGKSLWFYMLADGESTASTPLAQKWLASNVPTVPDLTGRGLLWQVIDEALHRSAMVRHSVVQALPTRWDPSVWKTTAGQPAFWWGDDASQQALAHWLVNDMPLGRRHTEGSLTANRNRLATVLAGIVENTDLTGLHPHLLGALVACDLFEFNMDTEKMARLNKLADAGALLVINDDRRPFLTDRHGFTRGTAAGAETVLDENVQAILARLEGNELRAMDCSDVPAPSATRARSRL